MVSVVERKLQHSLAGSGTDALRLDTAVRPYSGLHDH